MEKIKYTLLLAAFLAGTTFTACKKNATDVKKNCRIITVSAPSGIVYNFTYNNDGRLSTTTYGNYSVNYIYSGNSTLATTNYNGIFNKKETITLNSKGLGANVKMEPGPSGEIWANLLYEYNGEQLIKRTFTSSAAGTPEILVYTWTNGNVSSIFINGKLFVEYEYDTDKTTQTGEINNLFQFIEGYEIIRNKNLTKLSKYSSGAKNNFTYSFDSGGKIITAISDGGLNFTYQYQCN
jgi:YD repeat-containing protein